MFNQLKSKKIQCFQISGICLLLFLSGLISGSGAALNLPQRHMISTANPLASDAGREILRAGGSAVDAAIAAQAVLTLVEPQSSGIGGGAFLLHFRNTNRQIDAYDGRETAPAGIHPNIFLTTDGKRRPFKDTSRGGGAVGVPGLLRMLAMAHKEHGRLPWAQLFERATQLSENGFRVSPRLHQMIRRTPGLQFFPAAKAYFYGLNGNPVPEGHLLKNLPLANIYRRIASEGPNAFYTGEIATDIVRTIHTAVRNPAKMTVWDIQGYKPKKRQVLCRSYRKWHICGMPPPTSGGIAILQIFGFLEKFDLSSMAPGSVEALHLISEASRLAYADRHHFIGDPDFVNVPTNGLLDPEYLRVRARRISLTKSMGIVEQGKPPRSFKGAFAAGETDEFPSTSHLSVIDSAGNAVSMTSSIERAFGSRLMIHGFLLNNQLTDFAYFPHRSGLPVANAVAPGKRPRSSMSPTLVLDGSGRLFATLGSPGGSRIIAYVTQTLIGLLDWGLDMQSAINLPRHVNRNGVTELEKGTSIGKHKHLLRQLGHEVRIRSLNSGLQGIRVTAAGLDGGADRRREGISLGD
ncbi:MAG: gamma-glutamyltransferase [Pseudomonadota bacterium]|nr:gamma-glutamyltransferase [Pseudomonadota bacterium]